MCGRDRIRFLATRFHCLSISLRIVIKRICIYDVSVCVCLVQSRKVYHYKHTKQRADRTGNPRNYIHPLRPPIGDGAHHHTSREQQRSVYCRRVYRSGLMRVRADGGMTLQHFDDLCICGWWREALGVSINHSFRVSSGDV